jgi:cytidylate kinase
MKITVGGASGTGTSTIAKKLAEKYNLKFYSGGGIQRMNAASRNMTIEEYDVFLKAHPELDQDIENTQMKIGKTEDNLVLESRLGWYCIPDSIKIKLDCELNTRIQRMVDGGKDPNRVAQVSEDFEKTLEKTQKREATYDVRFKNLYNIEWNDDKNFDLVVDTTSIGIDAVFQKCVEYIEKHSVI